MNPDEVTNNNYLPFRSICTFFLGFCSACVDWVQKRVICLRLIRRKVVVFGSRCLALLFGEWFCGCLNTTATPCSPHCSLRWLIYTTTAQCGTVSLIFCYITKCQISDARLWSYSMVIYNSCCFHSGRMYCSTFSNLSFWPSLLISSKCALFYKRSCDECC